MNDTRFNPGPLADVSARPADGTRWTLVFTRTLHHPPEAVWAAITDPDQLGQWAPFTADRSLATTGDVVLTMVDGMEVDVSDARVTRADPPSLLEYTWGTQPLRWELEAVDGGTKLTLSHTVDASDWVPKVAAGWHLCLVVAERLLDGHPIPPIRGEDARNCGWQELNDAYAATLGIESTGFPE
jgi:uncharacterized protein YndB with AHSA1/START domain